MKVSKMPGFGSLGTVIENFDWQNPEDYKQLKDINIESLVTVVKGDGTDQFQHLIKNFRHTVTLRNLSNRRMMRHGPNWINTQSPEEKRAAELTSRWSLGDHAPNWHRVTGKRDNEGYRVGAFGDTELLWHSNEYASPSFCPVVALYGANHMNTSATCFLQTVDWYEKQTESFRSELDEMIVVGKWDNELLQPGSSFEDHITMKMAFVPDDTLRTPLVIKSPAGRKALHWSTWITGIEGLSKPDSDKLIAKITKEIFVDEYQYDYWWDHSQGDMVLFDNTVTMHMRKVKENMDLKSELHERLGYRNVGDYAGHEDYNPFLQIEFQEKRNRLMRVIRKINKTGWTYHMDILEKINDPIEQEKYILEKVSESDRDIVRAALTY
jgi:hypothetical protein